MIKHNVNAARDKVAAVISPSYLLYEFLGIAFQVYAYAFKTPIARGLAYFIGWMISYQITGAEFNPATTIGRVFAIKDYKNFKAALLTILAQYLGSLFGIFWVFFMLDQNGKIDLKPEPNDQLFTDLVTRDTYWARLIAYEVLMTAFFTIVYLILRFESSMKKVDRVVKGIACSITLGACLTMTNKSGASLNPALGFA